jgi:hypothetical protein
MEGNYEAGMLYGRAGGVARWQCADGARAVERLAAGLLSRSGRVCSSD